MFEDASLRLQSSRASSQFVDTVTANVKFLGTAATCGQCGLSRVLRLSRPEAASLPPRILTTPLLRARVCGSFAVLGWNRCSQCSLPRDRCSQCDISRVLFMPRMLSPLPLQLIHGHRGRFCGSLAFLGALGARHNLQPFPALTLVIGKAVVDD